MKKHTEITRARIHNFLKKLKGDYYAQPVPLEVLYCPSDEPLSFNDVQDKHFLPIALGEKWGAGFSCSWFKLSGVIPSTFKGKEVVALVDVGGEACVFNASGDPLQGITNKRIGQEFDEAEIKRRVYITGEAAGGEQVDLLLDAGANNIMGVTELFNSMVIADGTLNQAEIAIFHRNVWQLYLDYEFLYNLYLTLDPTSRHSRLLLYALNDVINHYTQFSDVPAVEKCRDILAVELQKQANASAMHVSAIGHAHIDIAWLWPLRETTRKAARSFATALTMIEEYDEYKFGASQPYLYEIVKQHFPALYERIKVAIKELRWECQGGMYVEADCNVTGGESLVRQLLYGKRFFKSEFNVEVDNLWLPDVFGYSAALPQMLKKSGINYFMTQKISWNQFNKFPHHTFMWKGIDGTEILSHFLANNTYNSPCQPENLRMFELENRDADRTDNALLLYGVGDGGGGPARKHIERLSRAKDLEDLPKVSMEYAKDFFQKLEETSRDLQRWEGELYLEYHRGTLTSQAQVKKRNRKLELMLRDVECLYALYLIDHYPQEELEVIWKSLLLNQFHDIIPGSSITRVYDECHQLYDQLETKLTALLAAFKTSRLGDGKFEEQGHVIFYNTLSWERSVAVEIPKQLMPGLPSKGADSAMFQIINRDGMQYCLGGVVLPPLGCAGFNAFSSFTDQVSVTVNGVSQYVMENELISVSIDENGFLDRIWDKTCGREVLVGVGNQLNCYEDIPITYEAWDIDVYYEEKQPKQAKLVATEIVETGPLRATVKLRFQGPDYLINQYVSLSNHSKRIDFDTEVDWKASQVMLRAEFPVNVYASRAAFEIQYGHVFRNTHENTSWDLAQFEVVAHKWADLSQQHYGVAILNDCKYGHRIKGNTISLNLLRAPKSPDETADMHIHRFKYALFPHAGDHLTGNVIQEAYSFNIPPLMAVNSHIDRATNGIAMLQVSGENVIVETIKKAEDSGDIIIRLYEAYGIDGLYDLTFGFQAKRVCQCALMEEEEVELDMVDGGVQLAFGPFEILTLKVSL